MKRRATHTPTDCGTGEAALFIASLTVIATAIAALMLIGALR